MQPTIKLELPPRFPRHTRIAIDTEFFGMTEGKLHRPTGKFACLTACADGQTVYVVTEEDQIAKAMERLQPAYWIMQNAMFDVFQLRRYTDIPPRQRLWDTMEIEKLLWSGYYDNFGLDHLARRYLKIVVSKTARDQFKTATELDEETLIYAAKDAQVTWHVANKQRPLVNERTKKLWYRVELPAMWGLLDFQGFPLDEEKWAHAAEDRAKDAERIAEELGFNPGSPPQSMQALEEEGFPVKSTGKEILKKVRGSKIAPKIIKYRAMKKLASTYGINWIKNDLESDGKIYPNYWLNGAKTGRPTSSNPCLTNIPIREYPVYRSYFIAPKDHVVLVADFSAQEVRVMAQLSRDKNLINAFRRGGNIYVQAAADVFGKKIQKGTTDYDDMKAIFLGTDYGMSDYGLAKNLGVTVKVAQQMQRKFFATYPGVRRWMLKQKKAGEYVETYLGRRFWLNPHSYQWYRNALNSPIQGGAADQLKLSIGMLHRRWNYDPFLLVTQVYDELVAIVHKDIEKEGTDLMQGAMIESGELVHPLVPAVADVSRGKNWLEAKD